MVDSDKGREFLERQKAERPTLLTSHDTKADLLKVWRFGMGRGDRTGWPALDSHYSVASAQITTITGYPNSGKSQFMDALAINLARQGWRFVFCSLENIPIYLHVEKLLRQYIGKPFREGPNPRMSEEEAMEGATDMEEWFSFIHPSDAKPNPSLDDVTESIESNFKDRGLWGAKDAKLACVIDPWNELEHFRPRGMTVTEYVGESLSRLRQWGRKTGLHIFIVAHPAKQYRPRESGKLPVCMPDMISDSAHFWNKSDNCITVALPEEHESPEVSIHIQKIRFAHIGRRGMVTLYHSRVTGRYQEQAIPKFSLVDNDR